MGAVPPALAAILDRRVTRRYAPDPVPEPLLQTVLAGAQSAPSKSDLQQYSVVVMRDRRRLVGDGHRRGIGGRWRSRCGYGVRGRALPVPLAPLGRLGLLLTF